ncbi:MAG: hypothetical protein V4559_01830 [Pseudomonadota bacterium]
MNMQSGGALRAIRLAGLALLLLGLLLPAFVNRQPVMYSDSVGYFHSGYAALKQAKSTLDAGRTGHESATPALARQEANGIGTARSVYYGLTYVVGYLIGGVWALALGQALLTLICLVLAAQRAVRLEPLHWLAALGGIVLLTGLNIFAVTAMPDLFAGLMLLAVAMILTYAPDLPRLEYAFWLAVVVVACLFHKAHLAILLVSLVVAAPFLWRRHAQGLLLLAGAALLAWGGHLAVDLAIRQATGKPPIATPFVLARLIGDGTAERYLRDVCPQRNFATCAYLEKMPMTENDFLWSREPDKSVIGAADRDTRIAIAAESDAIVMGTLQAYPAQEALAEAGNVLRQLGDVGVKEYGLTPKDEVGPIPMLAWALDHYRATGIAKGWMPLAEISVFMRSVYFAALVGIGMMLARRGRGGIALDSPEARFVLLLLTGIAVNALVSGAISGVFDRYQGRVAWLASLGFVVLLAKMLNDRRQPNNALKMR